MNAYLSLESTLWNRRLGSMIAVSLAAHVLFALAVLFWPAEKLRPVGMRFIAAEFVPGVPISPLPKGVPESRERYAPPDAEKPAAEKSPPPEPAVPPVAKSREMALPVTNPTARQKEREKIERQMDTAIARIRTRKQVGRQFGDREGIPGTQADYGESSMQDRILMLYLARIQQAVSQNWVRPMGIPANAKVKVVIFFRIDVRGGIFDARLDRSSGYAGADQTALQALKKSAPFASPPASIASGLQGEGIALIFEPGGR